MAAEPVADPEHPSTAVIVLRILELVAPLSILVGIYLAGAYVAMWISRALARLSFSAPALIAARRIAADPYATFRAVAGVAFAAFAATMGAAGVAAAQSETETDTVQLTERVVMVLTGGAPDETLAPLLAQPGAVDTRVGPGEPFGSGTVVIACPGAGPRHPAGVPGATDRGRPGAAAAAVHRGALHPQSGGRGRPVDRCRAIGREHGRRGPRDLRPDRRLDGGGGAHPYPSDHRRTVRPSRRPRADARENQGRIRVAFPMSGWTSQRMLER